MLLTYKGFVFTLPFKITNVSGGVFLVDPGKYDR